MYINLHFSYKSENYKCDGTYMLLFKFRHDDYVGGSAICWRDGRNRLIKHSCTNGEKTRPCNYQGLTAEKVSEGVSAS
jgi:SET domain-containing protein